jgi:hypothetical protein
MRLPSRKSAPILLALTCLTALTSGSGCTGQLAGTFRLQQTKESFNASQLVNTKLDMLWVIDNSGSMESVQTKVRTGLQQFAQQYMKPTWDIRVAAITTDAYLADSTFWAGPSGQTSYLTTVRSGTANYQMDYLNGSSHNYSGVVVPARSKHYYDTTSWITALAFPLFNSFEPTMYSPPTITANVSGVEKFLSTGLRIVDTKPQLGPNWAKLLVGNHDGPQLSMCWDGDESSPQFISGPTRCYRRDDPAHAQYHTGVSHCANPTGSESGASQCVNTFANNTVHTGHSIISTIPPTGTAPDQTWINQLISDFQVNLTPSTVGNGGERAFQSVLQFLNDNEPDPALRFFRPGSLRVIVFVADEDDQSQLSDPNQYLYGSNSSYGTGTPGNYVPGGGTKAHLIPEKASAPFICKRTYPSPNANTYFPGGDSGYCVDPAWLLPIGTVKQSLDDHFHQLDGTTSSMGANYFIAAITTMNTAGLAAQGYTYISHRYADLVDEVGNGSLTLDLTQSDYTPLLAQIGTNILQAKSVFQLARAPTGEEDLVVSIVHGDESVTVVAPAQYVLSGTALTIDLAIVSSLASTDSIDVSYRPSTVF